MLSENTSQDINLSLTYSAFIMLVEIGSVIQALKNISVFIDFFR